MGIAYCEQDGEWNLAGSGHRRLGVDYIVTADADGYVSAPVSYTIHLEGLAAYLVENGQLTDQEASHLDFHFEPK
jgi:hypothetical protein